QGEVIVRNGSPFAATDIEKIDALGLRETLPDFTSFGRWGLLAVLVVGVLLAWIWRFRPGLWHRDNVLILIGLLVVGATLALKIPAGRPTLPFFLPAGALASASVPPVSPGQRPHRDAAGGPARRVDRDHRHRRRRGHRWRGERQLARV